MLSEPSDAPGTSQKKHPFLYDWRDEKVGLQPGDREGQGECWFSLQVLLDGTYYADFEKSRIDQWSLTTYPMQKWSN